MLYCKALKKPPREAFLPPTSGKLFNDLGELGSIHQWAFHNFAFPCQSKVSKERWQTNNHLIQPSNAHIYGFRPAGQ